MDLVWIVGFVVSVCARFASAERHSVSWNSTNPKFLWDDYAVEVRLNDYLDIVCPHYPEGEVPLLDAERYVLYMVEREDYDSCKPQSYDQMRWECGHPFAPHAPEKFSEKFQRFTPFTLGKEFRQGESYYYIFWIIAIPRVMLLKISNLNKGKVQRRLARSCAHRDTGDWSVSVVLFEAFHGHGTGVSAQFAKFTRYSSC
ncbi:hypothetical protein F2P81_023379 [Scophthalmus maximus]|uniref:Ephrin RBD domain-containing protein n=1 Tax=Scophthalmus maximus TaxID=52904 RepID=A0A6A4RW23_SCOMX|nr:hypothetical protein F2P81_023379 [Scophthalmus maximus]